VGIQRNYIQPKKTKDQISMYNPSTRARSTQKKERKKERKKNGEKERIRKESTTKARLISSIDLNSFRMPRTKAKETQLDNSERN
jgi:hypothetical protein